MEVPFGHDKVKILLDVPEGVRWAVGFRKLEFSEYALYILAT